MADSTINLIFNLKNTEQLHAAQEELRALDGSLKAGEITAEQFEQELKRMAEAAARTGGAHAAAGAQVAQASERAGAALEAEAGMITRVDTAQQRLTATTGRATAEIYEFADVYDVVERQTREAAVAVDHFTRIIDEEIRTAQAAARSQEALGRAGTEAGRGGRNVGLAALEASRALEDLQFGLVGVMNNIPGIVMSLGGGAGLTAAISILSVAAFQLIKHWDDLRGIFEDRDPFPQVAMTAKTLEDALGRVNKSIDTMREKTSLNATEMEVYNKLLKEQSQLEADLAKQRETEANRKAHGPLADAGARETAEQVSKAVDETGGYEKVIERFVRAQQQREGIADTEKTRLAAIQRGFEDALNKALQGDKGTLSALQFETQHDQTGLTGTFGANLDLFNPENVRQRKRAEDLEAQGREGEELARKQREETDRQIAREREQRDREERDRRVAALERRSAQLAEQEAPGPESEPAPRPAPRRPASAAPAAPEPPARPRVPTGAEYPVEYPAPVFAQPPPITVGPGEGPPPVEAFATPFPVTPAPRPAPRNVRERLTRAAEKRAAQAQAKQRRQEAIRAQRAAKAERARQRRAASDIGRAEAAPQPLEMGPEGFIEPGRRTTAGLGRAVTPEARAAALADQQRRARESREGTARTGADVREAMARRMSAAEADRQLTVERLARERQERLAGAPGGVPRGPLPMIVGQAQAVTPGPRRGAPAGAGGGAGGPTNGQAALAPAIAQQTGVARQSVAAQQMGLQAVSALYAENQRLSATITQVYQAYRQLAGQTEARTKTAARRLN